MVLQTRLTWTPENLWVLSREKWEKPDPTSIEYIEMNIQYFSETWHFCLKYLYKKWNPEVKSEIFQAFYSWNVDDYGLKIMKTQNSVSQKIWVFIICKP